jgi:hypothetical protein
VQRTTGFGFGIFIMTMLPFFLPTYGEATTLSGLLAITTSAVIVWKLRSFVTWKRLWPILLTFIIISTIAIFALTRIEDHILRRILGEEHYMAMAQTYFLIGNIMMTFVRAYNGFLTTTVLTDYCFGLGGVIIGTALGAYVFKHIPNRIFRYIVYAYIAVSGVIILLSSCHN